MFLFYTNYSKCVIRIKRNNLIIILRYNVDKLIFYKIWVSHSSECLSYGKSWLKYKLLDKSYVIYVFKLHTQKN